MDNNNLKPNRLKSFCSTTLKARSLSKPNQELFSALFNKTTIHIAKIYDHTIFRCTQLMGID